MLKQLMSALGVQGATIDTRIFDSNTQGGAWLEGEIRVEAGESDQVINQIALQLKTIAEVEAGDHEFSQPLVLQTWPVTTGFRLAARQRFAIPFRIQLPYETPVTQVACRRNSRSSRRPGPSRRAACPADRAVSDQPSSLLWAMMRETRP